MNKKIHSKLIITYHECLDEVAINDGGKALKGLPHIQALLPESIKTNEITSNIAWENKTVSRCTSNYGSLDTRVESLDCNNNDANKKNILNNFSRSDIRRLLCFIEIMYNTMQSLLEDASCTESMSKGSFGIIIDIERYYNFETRSTDLIKSTIGFTPQEICAISKNNYLKACIAQQQCTGFLKSISICECSFNNDSLKELTAVCSPAGDSSPCCETMKSLSLCFKNWPFYNITQGYLMRIILGNLDVPTLSVMRNMYFVIFRNDAPNNYIDINFKFRGVMIDDIQPVTDFLPTAMQWSSAHQEILKDVLPINAWSILSNSNNDTKLFGAITFPKVSQNDPHIIEPHEPLNQDASSDTTEIDILHIVLFDVESLDVKSSQSDINIDVKESTRCSFNSLVEEIVSRHSILETDKVSANKVKGRTFRSELRSKNNSVLINVKLWLTSIVGRLHEQDSSINKLSTLKDDYINETMFESTYVSGFLKWFNKHCEHFMCQTFHKNFLKCLGQSLLQLHCGTMLA